MIQPFVIVVIVVPKEAAACKDVVREQGTRGLVDNLERELSA